MLLTTLLGCAATEADRFLSFVRGDDGYSVEPVELPSLEDPVRMSGDLGLIEHGGTFAGDVDTPTWTGGVPLDVRFSVQEGVAIPADQDGLLLFSFWAHLERARAAMEEHDIDTSPIFPVDMAWNPAVDWELELAPADNAAYGIGANIFVLLADGGNRDVPLLANEGVIRHEFGHAIFHLLTAGHPLDPPVITDVDTTPAYWQASIHEAFADIVATLTLDDPRFLDASLEMPDRWVDGEAVMEGSLEPANAGTSSEEELFAYYDPYPLGTVFASAVWDVRLELDDPVATLDLVFRGVERWDPGAAFDGYGLLDAWVEAAETDAERAAVCNAAALRFEGFATPTGCG